MRRILHLNLAQASVWKSYGFSKKNIDSRVSAPDRFTVQIVLPKDNDPQLVIYSLAALGNLGCWTVKRCKATSRITTGVTAG